MKFKLNSVSSKIKPNRKSLLIVAGSLLALFIVAVAVAAYQANVKHTEAVKLAEQERVAAQEKQRIDELNDLKADKALLQAQKKSLCSNYQQLSTARATRNFVIVPTACSVNVE